MRTPLSALQLTRPADLDDALRMMAEGARPFAGGTDLMVQLYGGSPTPQRFVDIAGLSALAGIQEHADHLDLGALCTYTELREHPALAALPSLIRAAELTGAVAIQNRGTLGGNIGNASPAADSLPCLLAYDARLVLLSPRGSRTVPYAAFHRGYKELDLAPDELIARIVVPRPGAGDLHYFRKVGARRAQAIAKVNLALVARVRDRRLELIRIGLGAVAPTPVRAFHAEEVLTGQSLDDLPIGNAQKALDDDIAPIDDLRSTAHYRTVVARGLLADALTTLTTGGP